MAVILDNVHLKAYVAGMLYTELQLIVSVTSHHLLSIYCVLCNTYGLIYSS